MKKILFTLLLFPLLVLGQSKNMNFVKTLVYKKESSGAITTLDTIVNVDYFDGLGRPMQSIAVKGGGGDKDLVQHYEYNESGKQDKQYLTYAVPLRTIVPNTPNYRYGIVDTQKKYYKTQFPSDVYGTDAFTYSEIKTDGSPLGRIVEQAGPGNVWAIGSGHTIKTDYDTNTDLDQVYDFRIKFTNSDTEKPETYMGGSRFANSQYYTVGSLYKTVTKDENWISTDGNNKTTHEFKDKLGRLILKRTFNAGIAHDTYYVYDMFGNLTYVIPPQALATTGFITRETVDFLIYYNVNQAILSKFAYLYKYDSRNRVIEKQVPDKGIEYILYDKLDRPVLTQNANQRIAQKWSFVKYDKFGRIVYSGEYTTTKSIDILKAELSAATILSENKTDSAFFTLNGTNVNYTNNAIPNVGLELYAVNYYDTTTFSKPAGMEVPATVAFGTTSTLTKGLPTGSKVRVLEPGSTSWITTVIGYDVKARGIWIKNDNLYYATNNTLELRLNFLGQPIETKTIHSKTGNSSITISDYYDYDFVGRSTTHKQQIDNTPIQTISNKTYNERGQLLGKALGGSGASGAQKIDYAYNIRGWLKNINDPNNLNGDIFAESLSYNLPTAGGTALFNGNISQTSWKTSNDNNLRTYNYKYDALNRITSGIFTNSTVVSQNNNFNLNSVTYDRNGNITFMHRAGDIKGQGSSQINMDYMSYVYEGNKLLRIKEDGDQTKGFKGGNPLSLVDQYQYDSMGNLTVDTNKRITKIEYNHLGLPSKISFGSSKYIGYVYDGKGNKLKKIHFNGVTTATTEYNTGIIYLKSGTASSTLQYIPTQEGYAFKNAGGTFSYAYQIKDHLGNVRITFTDLNNNSIISTDEIIEESNYDPFGLKHTGYNFLYLPIGNSFAQKLKFNGKEYEEGLDGLDFSMNEMDWRHYDPAIGRFNCIDKLAESFFDVTPYNFANNNPIYFNDPTGLGPVQTNYGVDAFGRQMYNENGMYIVPGARGGEVPFNMFNYMDGGNGYGGIRKAMANFFNNPTTGAMFARVYNEPYVINDGSGEVLDTVVLGFWETVEFGNSSDALEVGGATSDILRNMIYSTDGWLGKNGKFNSIDWGGNQHTGSRSGSLKASNGFKWLGRGAVYASFAIKGIELNQAYLKDGKKFGYNTERKLYTAAGSIAAGIIGAEIGAKVGVGIGVWFGGVGAVPAGVIGTIAGGVIGSVSGYFAGEAGDHYVGQVYDYYYFK